ncbi:hypothetical protein [Hyphomicrobium sp.]|uniref:hypothetical protein n=1 Tax=Hyphomicrobium sp. TaxID=82 RepID=UPI002BF09BF9|nr:hypothetical protein [Hyphomicrobium sp.]HRN89454.1 hypothetical protein [Hyphomicrobium sp.]HRQ26532.1 hypothetical protein [Hyphomicrobium sp.]
MRSALSFLSLLAFGVLGAGILTVVGSADGDAAVAELLGLDAGDGLHFGSLFVGLVLGVVLSALARVSWSELPRRSVEWLLSHERIFFRLGLVGVFLGILVFY